MDIIFRSLCMTDEKVIGFYIAMNILVFMHLLDYFQKVYSNLNDCLYVESSPALVKEVIKGWPQQLHDHDVNGLLSVRSVSSNIVKLRHRSYMSMFRNG